MIFIYSYNTLYLYSIPFFIIISYHLFLLAFVDFKYAVTL